MLLRLAEGRAPTPTAVIFDSRTVQASPESGQRAGHDGAQRTRGAQIPVAVDTLGHLLALYVTAASEQDRAQVKRRAAAVQEATGDSVELGYGDQGYRGEDPAEEAAAQGIRLEVIKLPEAKQGCVAASCGPGAGSWSAAAPGWPASVASPATTSACPRPLPACISSPSPVSCSIVSSSSSTVPKFITRSRQLAQEYGNSPEVWQVVIYAGSMFLRRATSS
jgi:hypothetical protein